MPSLNFGPDAFRGATVIFTNHNHVAVHPLQAYPQQWAYAGSQYSAPAHPLPQLSPPSFPYSSLYTSSNSPAHPTLPARHTTPAVTTPSTETTSPFPASPLPAPSATHRSDAPIPRNALPWSVHSGVPGYEAYFGTGLGRHNDHRHGMTPTRTNAVAAGIWQLPTSAQVGPDTHQEQPQAKKLHSHPSHVSVLPKQATAHKTNAGIPLLNERGEHGSGPHETGGSRSVEGFGEDMRVGTAKQAVHLEVKKILQEAASIASTRMPRHHATYAEHYAYIQLNGPLSYASPFVDGDGQIKHVNMNQEPSPDLGAALIDHRVVVCLRDKVSGSFSDPDDPLEVLLERLAAESLPTKKSGPGRRRKQLAVQDANTPLGREEGLTKAMHVTKFRKAAQARKNGYNSLDLYLSGIEDNLPALARDPGWSLIHEIEPYLESSGKDDDATFGRKGRLSAWLLMALGGSHSIPHEDEMGLDTILHLVQGHCVVGFCLMKEESDTKAWSEACREYSKDVDRYLVALKRMSWVQTVIEPGTTLIFRGGTPHYVSRFYSGQNQERCAGEKDNAATLIIGGHIKRPLVDDIRELLRKQREHLDNPNMTNEDVANVPLAGALLHWLESGRAAVFLREEEVALMKRECARHAKEISRIITDGDTDGR